MRYVPLRRWLFRGSLALLAATAVRPLAAQEVEVLPPLRVVVSGATPAVAPANTKILPLSLDTVMHLAGDQNGQVRLARLRVEEANLRHASADRHWLPEMTIGPSYYRHEGGIQDFNGQFIRSSYGSTFIGAELRGRLDLRELTVKRIEAERSAVLRRGELSKLTSEQLLDAASTYVDLLAARTGEAIAKETEGRLENLLVQARKLASLDPGVNIEAVRAEAELESQKVLARKFREGSESAKLKLLYTLGLEQSSEVALLDEITMFRLIDENRPAEALVEEALRDGPGVAELARLLAVVDRICAEADCNKKWIPALEVTLAEGGFGAGPGSRSEWDHRFDAAVHLRWSINDLCGSREKLRLLDNQRQQAHQTFQDLRARLDLGVRQALTELRSSQDQLALAMKHIAYAEESYRLSDSRLRENIKGRSPSEVLLATRSLFAARMSYLTALRDYDKAQIRLFVLTGRVDAGRCSGK